jgi:(S)-mandelate dehydrogenase
MRLENAINIEDLRLAAKRRLPKLAFDFIEGGVEGERALVRNETAFQRYRLMPRYLVNIATRSQATTIFGRTWASPFGFCPTGMAGLWRPGTDLLLAQTAAKMDIPSLMSCASNLAIEKAVAAAPKNMWFQIYCGRERRYTDEFLKRVAGLGIETVVITIDVPVSPKRERNMRNRFSRPLKLTGKSFTDVMRHPGWLWHFWRNGGIPSMENWEGFLEPGQPKDKSSDLYATQTPAGDQTWRDLDHIRRNWSGNLVLKGIIDPEDALLAQQAGVNGIIVSNHGGRQLDMAPASLEALPAVRAAVGPEMTVMLDSGVRRGSDVILALCLGASFCFVGRAALYGAAAFGQEGVDKAGDILRKEIDLNMAQMGVTAVEQLGPERVRRDGPRGLERLEVNA